MSFERSIGPAAEPAPTPGPAGADPSSTGGITPAMRLQILSTEHWSLLASRSLAFVLAFAWYAGRDIARIRREHVPMFPTRPSPDA